MRGAERPAKVRWTHPFLKPLKPLSDAAARQTFIDIAEDFHENQDVKEVLSLTDNMPLAVDLIAHAVDYEGGCANVLTRWRTEKTSVLSEGYDRRSNLDASIRISLSSPRMSSGAKDLLSLLSILPDGLSDVELVQSKLQIENILACRATLLATSLVYTDDNKRIKSLMPIREHVEQFYPPSAVLIQCLQKHFHQLLDLYHKYSGTQQAPGRIHPLASNVKNLQHLLLRALQQENLNLADTIDITVSLKHFARQTRHSYQLNDVFIEQIAAVLPENCDPILKTQLILARFEEAYQYPIGNADVLIAETLCRLRDLDEPMLECEFDI
jgi:hypothetical protein